MEHWSGNGGAWKMDNGLACRAMRSGARRSVDASLLKRLFRLSGCCRVAASMLTDFTTPMKRDETPELGYNMEEPALIGYRFPLPEKVCHGNSSQKKQSSRQKRRLLREEHG